jgi:hypothetical protein
MTAIRVQPAVRPPSLLAGPYRLPTIGITLVVVLLVSHA